MGHTEAGIQDYTITQIKEYSKGAVNFYQTQRAIALQTTALGAQGSGKAIEQTIKQLLRKN